MYTSFHIKNYENKDFRLAEFEVPITSDTKHQKVLVKTYEPLNGLFFTISSDVTIAETDTSQSLQRQSNGIFVKFSVDPVYQIWVKYTPIISLQFIDENGGFIPFTEENKPLIHVEYEDLNNSSA